MTHRLVRLLLSLLLTFPGSAWAQQPTVGLASTPADGAAVVVSRATQYDLTSRVNGQTYRILVATPIAADSGTAYPVVYVLDGNWYFNTFADALTVQSPPGNGPLASAIVVGIGYPTEDRQEVVQRRSFDMYASPVTDGSYPRKTGGGDAFLRVLVEEIKPFISARYQVDRAQQIIFGHSAGGHIVLRSMFRNPQAFSTYLIADPVLFFNNREVLADEGTFADRAQSGELNLKVFIASADPQHVTDPAARAEIDAVSDLAARLRGLHPNVSVQWNLFPGEVHHSVALASLSRGLRFALPRQQ